MTTFSTTITNVTLGAMTSEAELCYVECRLCWMSRCFYCYAECHYVECRYSGASSKVLISECHSAMHHLSKCYSKYNFVGCHFSTSHCAVLVIAVTSENSLISLFL